METERLMEERICETDEFWPCIERPREWYR